MDVQYSLCHCVVRKDNATSLYKVFVEAVVHSYVIFDARAQRLSILGLTDVSPPSRLGAPAVIWAMRSQDMS